MTLFLQTSFKIFPGYVHLHFPGTEADFFGAIILRPDDFRISPHPVAVAVAAKVGPDCLNILLIAVGTETQTAGQIGTGYLDAAVHF